MQKCRASTNHRAVFDDLAVHIRGPCRHTNHRVPFDDLAVQRAVQAHQSTNHRLLIDDLAVQRAVQEHQSPSANRQFGRANEAHSKRELGPLLYLSDMKTYDAFAHTKIWLL